MLRLARRSEARPWSVAFFVGQCVQTRSIFSACQPALYAGSTPDAIGSDGRQPPGPKRRAPAEFPEEGKQHDERQRTKGVEMDRLSPMTLGESTEGARDSAKRARTVGKPIERAQVEGRLVGRRQPPEEGEESGGGQWGGPPGPQPAPWPAFPITVNIFGERAGRGRPAAQRAPPRGSAPPRPRGRPQYAGQIRRSPCMP
jgi:hypothetical protein